MNAWTVTNSIVSTIAENTVKILNVSDKARICPQCTQMNEKKKKMGLYNSKVSQLVYQT